MNELEQELCHWLDQQPVTSENIGALRRMCFVPWDSRWNAIVREQTAVRENKRLLKAISPPAAASNDG